MPTNSKTKNLNKNPLIGSQAIIFDACSPPEFTCVIRKNKDKYIVISLLKDYATLFKEGEFYA